MSNFRIGNVVCRKHDYGQEEVVITEDNINEEFSGIPISVQNLVKILGFTITTFYTDISRPVEEIMYEAGDQIIRYKPHGEFAFEIDGIAKFNIGTIHQLQNIIQDLIGYGMVHV